MTTVRLTDLFKFYKHGTPHQMSAVAELEAELMAAAPEVFERSRPWYRTWQQAGKLHDYEPAIKLIKEFEGCHLSAYPDPLHGWDVATIGYGTTRYPDGRKVQRGDKITVLDAQELLEIEVERIAAKLRASVPHWGAMRQGQQCALLSFAYNLGAGFYGSAGFETISKRLREKDWAQVPAAMELYRNPGSSVEAGLLRRRRAEGALWREGQPEVQQSGVMLQVPYELQHDNRSGAGYRECFSSSAAMVARFHGKVANDDAYNAIRQRFGDTTDAMAQVKALNSLGLVAQFRTNATVELLEAELEAGRPVMVGWLHHGPASRPTGGGHWSVVVGMTPKAFVHNDPNGEADLVNGGYVNTTAGRNVAYSRQNWLRRWLPDGPSSGWCITVRR
jgi:GH24 family phage-related lysozyme (muramidase)